MTAPPATYFDLKLDRWNRREGSANGGKQTPVLAVAPYQLSMRPTIAYGQAGTRSYRHLEIACEGRSRPLDAFFCADRRAMAKNLAARQRTAGWVMQSSSAVLLEFIVSATTRNTELEILGIREELVDVGAHSLQCLSFRSDIDIDDATNLIMVDLRWRVDQLNVGDRAQKVCHRRSDCRAQASEG